MGSIPLPALHVNPPAQQDPMAGLEKLVQLKSLMNQQQIQQQQVQAGGLENQQRQMDLDSQKALQKAYMESNGDPDKTTQLAAKYGAKPQALLQWQNSVLEQKAKTLDLVSKQGEQAKIQADLMQGAHDAVTQASAADKPSVYQQQLMGLQQRGMDVSKLPPQYPGDEMFKMIGATVKTHTQMVEDALKQSEAAKNTAQGQDAAVAAQQKALTLAGTNPQGITADQQATLKQGQQRTNIDFARLAEEKRHNQSTEGSLTPDALKMAADQYAATGQMPAVGRTAGIRSQIMNQAALDHPKIDIATNAAAYNANKESLKKLQSGFDQVTAFENTAGKNLDQFLTTAKKVVDSGSPWLNTPIRNINANMVGSENMAAFNAARTTALTEISKVLTSSNATGGAVSDSARGEVSGLIGPNATLKQIYAAANILKQDMANRHQSYADQISDIKQRIGGGQGQTQQAAPTGATMKVPGSDGKMHWSDGKKDLGVAQ